MNTVEKIVESYYRLCRKCFTISDLKVLKGNNRQLDLLAISIKPKKCYHVEVSVTHRKNWCPTPEILIENFEKKFFGVPPVRDGAKTDFSTGKNYKTSIDNTYSSVGINPDTIRRVWVCWIVNGAERLQPILKDYCTKKGIRRSHLEVLSLRDEIIPELLNTVSTTNYDDDILRTLSLLEQHRKQRE
ncbi:MAG: hypothetical protein HOD37_15585 [Bacteroidetes bacterium]|jgi:hypothetical protein|nr:hypothetical protein [Bacteroidota bacterium]